MERPICQTPGCKNLAAKYAQKTKVWYKKHCTSCNRKRTRGDAYHTHEKDVARQRRERNRLKALRHYSGGDPKCACCGEANVEFLCIDHIHGDGNTHRREQRIDKLAGWLVKNKFPDGFRVLCFNCNQSHGAYGYCPHEGLTEEQKMARRAERVAKWFGQKQLTGA